MGAYNIGICGEFKPVEAKGLYILATDEKTDTLEKIVEKVKQSEFVVLQASYENVLSREADVIIPSLIWAERSGSYTNLEGMTQRVNRSITPPPEIKEDREIMIGIADKMEKSLL